MFRTYHPIYASRLTELDRAYAQIPTICSLNNLTIQEACQQFGYSDFGRMSQEQVIELRDRLVLLSRQMPTL
jgi:hypothetical protein